MQGDGRPGMQECIRDELGHHQGGVVGPAFERTALEPADDMVAR